VGVISLQRISPKSNTVLMCRKSGFIFASLDEFDASKTCDQRDFGGGMCRDHIHEGSARDKALTEKLRLFPECLPTHYRVLCLGCAVWGIGFRPILKLGVRSAHLGKRRMQVLNTASAMHRFLSSSDGTLESVANLSCPWSADGIRFFESE